MEVQPTNGRCVSGPAEALRRETIEALWARLDQHHLAGLTDAIASPDELGLLLAEIERLKGELRVTRELYRSDDEHAVRVPVPLLAALELVARDVRAWRHAQDEWLARRAPHVDSVEAYVRVFEDLELLAQVEGSCIPSARLGEVLLVLTLDQLRALAAREAPPASAATSGVRVALAELRAAAIVADVEPVCVCGHTQDEHAPFSGACDAGACGCLCFDEAPEDGSGEPGDGADL